jgi:hypothetical protein
MTHTIEWIALDPRDNDALEVHWIVIGKRREFLASSARRIRSITTDGLQVRAATATRASEVQPCRWP